MTTRRSALEAATAALARRDRSAADLTAYLQRRGAPAEDAALAVERLRQAGYVDDDRYAAARAESLAGRGYGDDAIRRELAGDGVEPEAITAALDGLPAERDRAVDTLRHARTPLAGARRLAAKGFSPDAIESALAAWPQEEVSTRDLG